MKRTVHLPLHIPTLLFVAVAVGLYVFFTQFVFAHGGDTNNIHACVKTNGGALRIVGANDTCNSNETALDWRNGISDPPFVCPGCSIGATGNFGNRFVGKDLTDSYFDYSDFSGTNLSGANFTRASLQQSNFSVVDLTNVNFTNANLLGASNMETTVLTGVTWSNTTCPDGTNSDTNGNTCEGHLTP